jgi:hypothetical protein
MKKKKKQNKTEVGVIAIIKFIFIQKSGGSVLSA